MHATQPRVSILMPVFNAVPYLAEAIESVLAQTITEAWELLLIEDGSFDSSLAVARDFAARHADRIQVLQHESGANRGTSASRNLGLRHARGEFVAFLDADDVWLPHMLATQLAMFRKYPEATLVYANAERTWEMHLPCGSGSTAHGVNELPPLLPENALPGLLPSPWPLPWFLADETKTPCTCTVLVKTAAALTAGGFVDSFNGLYDDQAFYAKIMLQGQTAVHPDCVARYRRHYTSCCAQTWHNLELQAQARLAFEVWLRGYLAAEPAADELQFTIDTAKAFA